MILNSLKYDDFRFDWYSASIPNDPIHVIETMRSGFAASPEATNGPPQYERTVGLFDPFGEMLFKVSFGGNDGAPPHLQTSGWPAHEVVQSLRNHFPHHKVSRVDVALDFVDPRLFDAMAPRLREVSRSRRVQYGSYNMDVPENGRTIYLGASASPVRFRLYEKDKEREAKGEKGIPHHVRAEIQVRPRSREKSAFSAMRALDVWGAARWSREVLDYLSPFKPTPFERDKPVHLDPEEKFRWFIRNHWSQFRQVDPETALRVLAQVYEEGLNTLDRLHDAEIPPHLSRH